MAHCNESIPVMEDNPVLQKTFKPVKYDPGLCAAIPIIIFAESDSLRNWLRTRNFFQVNKYDLIHFQVILMLQTFRVDLIPMNYKRFGACNAYRVIMTYFTTVLLFYVNAFWLIKSSCIVHV